MEPKTVAWLHKRILVHSKQNSRKKHFKWFNKECILKKKEFEVARRRWRDNKNIINLDQMRQASRKYKKQINRAKGNEREQILNELKELPAQIKTLKFFGMFSKMVQEEGKRVIWIL